MRNQKLIIGIAIFVVFCLSSSLMSLEPKTSNNYNDNSQILKADNIDTKEIVDEKEEIPKTATYDLTGQNIIIQDWSSATNWQQTAAKYPWCTFSGGYYIIEDVMMDGDGYISIYDSTRPFIIRGSYFRDAAIYLNSVDNGIITDNELRGGYYGIYLVGDSNVISLNTIHHHEYGVYSIPDCDDNEITGNDIYECNYGLYIYGAAHNTERTDILGNTIHDCGVGIWMDDCIYSTLSGNTVYLNRGHGIYVINSDYTDVLNNDASNNVVRLYKNGIHLYNCLHGMISGNTASDNGDGIYLGGCSDISVSGNTMNDDNSVGIYLGGCSDISLSGNTMQNCGIGILGGKNELSSLTIDTTNKVNDKSTYFYSERIGLGASDFSTAGDPGQIILVNCNDSVLSGYSISYGSYGISLHYCNDNDISGVNASNHRIAGLELRNSHLNDIANGYANDNSQYGICLYSSNDNYIANNDLRGNGECIYESSDSIGNVNENNICVDDGGNGDDDDGGDDDDNGGGGGGGGGGDGDDDGDDKGGATGSNDLLNFLLSPVGMVIVGSIATGGIVGLIVIIKKMSAAKVRK